jgi:murein DD-endopeptidase MepM/ murein hydrolase activator NlpD
MATPTLDKNIDARYCSAKAGRLRLIAAALAASALLAGTASRADIYRFVDEEGVECFTDTPAKGGATRIMKERNGSRRTTQVDTAHRQLPATSERKNAVDRAGATTVTRTDAALLSIQGTISSPVGMRHDPLDGRLRHHNGVDIAVAEGTPVRPVAPGIVSFSGFRPGYGNLVSIAHDDGMITIYAHNSVNLVREGELVDAGATIALTGSTGRSTGPHLHFEAWKDGTNLTQAFVSGMPGSANGPHRHDDSIQRILQADGSLLFTNLR